MLHAAGQRALPARAVQRGECVGEMASSSALEQATLAQVLSRLP